MSRGQWPPTWFDAAASGVGGRKAYARSGQ
jgi:hypothetical protein